MKAKIVKEVLNESLKAELINQLLFLITKEQNNNSMGNAYDRKYLESLSEEQLDELLRDHNMRTMMKKR